MAAKTHENEHTSNPRLRFLVGLLFGGLIGGGVALLLAPQSGIRTRARIQLKGIELRDQTTDAMTQGRVRARHIAADIGDTVEDLQHRGQRMLDDQKERLIHLIARGKKTVLGSPA
jgi:gas vesicle protein